MSFRPGDGVLLVAHGTVDDPARIPEFLTEIRRGRPPGDELIEEMRERYAAIGGSPLLETTRAQAAALSERLGIPAWVAMRFGEPKIRRVLAEASASAERLCVLPMAPYSVHIYCGVAREDAESLREELPRVPELRCVEPWGTEPALIDAHVEAIRAHLQGGSERVLFSAHSLPVRVIRAGDPYEDQVRASAEAVGSALGVPWSLSFQSQGAGGGEWLGPDVREELERAKADGVERVVNAPIGFLADHLETLYDLDIEAKQQAAEIGIELARVPALNVNPGLTEAMASAVERAVGV